MIDRRTIDEIARDDAKPDAAHAGRFRAMDTSLGRWTRTDPLGYADGANRYNAFSDSPVTLLDPTGLTTISQDAKTPSGSTSPFSPSSGAQPGSGPSAAAITSCRVRTRLSYPHAGIEIDAGDAGGFIVDGSGGENGILINEVDLGGPRGVRGPWKTLTPEQCKCLLGADRSGPVAPETPLPEGAIPIRAPDDSTLGEWRRRANNYPYTFLPPWNSNWSLKCFMKWCGLKVRWNVPVPGWDTPCPGQPGEGCKEGR